MFGKIKKAIRETKENAKVFRVFVPDRMNPAATIFWCEPIENLTQEKILEKIVSVKNSSPLIAKVTYDFYVNYIGQFSLVEDENAPKKISAIGKYLQEVN